jgi:trehalose-6-phosphate synthase
MSSHLVPELTARLATFKHTPVHYLHRSVKPECLCALYAIADVCIISSIRDGLNLVSYEYAACQDEDGGVLMMSTYAGAMKTLPQHSMICFNPWDTPRFAEAIREAVSMDRHARMERHRGVMKIVDTWTSAKWGKAFLETMMSGDLPKNKDMPDRDPLEDQASGPFEAVAGNIVADAEEVGRKLDEEGK